MYVMLHFIITNQFSSPDTVKFTQCDPFLKIATLWVSDSTSPFPETDDVVHNKYSVF